MELVPSEVWGVSRFTIKVFEVSIDVLWIKNSNPLVENVSWFHNEGCWGLFIVSKGAVSPNKLPPNLGELSEVRLEAP